MATYTYTYPAVPVTTAVSATQVVSLKDDWVDPWVEEPYLWCDRCDWCASPDMPTATLFWRYGLGREPDDLGTFKQVQQKLLTTRQYVRITIGDVGTSNYREWYGIIEANQHRPHGSGATTTAVLAGEQTFTAYAIDILLSKTPITTSVVKTGVIINNVPINRGIAFNEEGNPNKNGLPDADGTYLFVEGPWLDPEPEYWSTRDIVRYLVKHHSPRREDGTEVIPLLIEQPDYDLLPDWDSPTIQTHGHKLRDVMNQIMARQRLLTWYIDELGGIFYVRVVTLVENDLSVGNNIIKANPNQVILDDSSCASMMTSLQETSTDRYDMVTVQGARRTACFSIKLDGDVAFVNDWESWTNADEQAYDEGFSENADYPDVAEVRDRRLLNERVRNLYPKVYRVWDCPIQFNGTIPYLPNPGVGDVVIDPTAEGDYLLAAGHRVLADGSFKLLKSLPIQLGVDYSGRNIADGNASYVPGLPFEVPFAVTTLPQDPAVLSTQYQYVRNIGRSQDTVIYEDSETTWSCSTSVSGRTITINVNNGPQHMIAKDVFIPLEDDEESGQYDFRNFIITIACEVDSYASASFATGGADAMRELVINAGSGYRKDFIAPGTITGINPVNLDWQYTETGGYIRNDEDRLLVLAETAYNWYSVPRNAITQSGMWQDPVVVGADNRPMAIGDLITTHRRQGVPAPVDTSVNSVVTRITFAAPRMQNSSAGIPIKWQMNTSFAQFDVNVFGGLRHDAVKAKKRQFGVRRGGGRRGA